MADLLTADQTSENGGIGRWAWHIHHDRLCEQLTESIAERAAYIRTQKPPAEVPTRLRLLRLVVDQAGVTAAARAYDAAVAAAEWVGFDQAWETRTAAWKISAEAVTTIHARECLNCPWDGRTIFPGSQSDD